MHHQVNQQYIIKKVVGYVLLANYITTFCLNIGWVVQCIRYLWLYVLMYRACKRAPNLHPVHRDVQYLSRQRKLYNIKTHIVKYVLIILYLCVEISCSVWLGFCFLFPPLSDAKFFAKRNRIQSQYSHCYIHSYLAHLYFSPIYIIMYNVEFLLILLQISLLCILTRYLVARYLNHSSKRTLINYFTWIAVQSILIALFSNIYTYIFLIQLIPILITVDWILLLRDSLILSRVLKSNLREIKLHSTNTVLYMEQYYAFKYYRIFNKFILLSFFLLIAVVTLLCLLQSFLLIFDSFCLLEYIYGFNYSPYSNISLSLNFKLELNENTINYVAVAIYSFSTSLPLLCATLTPLIVACVKRYRTRHSVYRFNYDNIQQPLLRGHR